MSKKIHNLDPLVGRASYAMRSRLVEAQELGTSLEIRTAASIHLG
jgi:hypothetical protein